MRSAILLRITARSAADVLPQAGRGGVRGVERLLDVGLVGAGHLAERLAGDRVSGSRSSGRRSGGTHSPPM